jgi:hypothetical protein
MFTIVWNVLGHHSGEHLVFLPEQSSFPFLLWPALDYWGNPVPQYRHMWSMGLSQEQAGDPNLA